MSAMQTECLGGGGAVALAVGEGANDQLASITIDGVVVGHLMRHSGRLGADDSGGQVMKGQFRAIRQDDGALDDIGELADVAGPMVGDKFIAGFVGYVGKALLGFGGKSFEKKVRKGGNIFFSFA